MITNIEEDEKLKVTYKWKKNKMLEAKRNLESKVDRFIDEKQEQHELLVNSNYENLMISRVVKKEVIDIADTIDELK